MEQHHPEPQPPALSKVEGPAPLPTIPVLTKAGTQSASAEGRHGGWTGEKMAIFCETLAETGVVEEACEVAMMGVSGAYAARRRSPIFAAAWQAALSIGRERLADRLLSRAIEGNVEQIYRDGELVGERHVIDNRLGLAILRRLDRLAETGQAVATRSAAAVTLARHPDPRSNGPVCHPASIDWTQAVQALRSGDDAGVAQALAIVQGNEVEEVEDSPVSLIEGDTFDAESDQSDRCWWDDREGCWMTDFPPPAHFTGHDNRDYDDPDQDEPYQRACTTEESTILEADRARAIGAAREDEEDRRDAWFARLKADAEWTPPDGAEAGFEEREPDVRVAAAVMSGNKLYDEATDVTAKDGEVILDGPDAVDVKITPEAAEQTAENLVEGAVRARGQRRLKDLPHRPA